MLCSILALLIFFEAVSMDIFPQGAKMPDFVMQLFPECVWRRNTPDTIFLTFDDGPTPDVTEFVLQQLQQYNAQGTFFCIGKNVQQHPEIIEKILSKKHVIANHTMHHLNGWKATAEVYKQEIEACEALLNHHQPLLNEQRMFRPPYGRITPSQIREVGKTHQLILWDVLSYDFNENIDGEAVAQLVIKHTEPGSIVVFHDSVKAFPRLKIALPIVLDYFTKMGWKFAALTLNTTHGN